MQMAFDLRSATADIANRRSASTSGGTGARVTTRHAAGSGPGRGTYRYDGYVSVVGDVTVTGGTRRFLHARRTLTLGPLVSSNAHNCEPRIGLCLDRDEAGPLTGSLTRR